MKPELTIVIPIYNEAPILESETRALLSALRNTTLSTHWELLFVENGSKDSTKEIAEELVRQNPEVRLLSLAQASYGRALKAGIQNARGIYTAVFNIDFWDTEFLGQAMQRIEEADIVIGSKTMRGSRDTRPLTRRLITRAFNLLLRTVFKFKGTDTHGIKLFRTAPVQALMPFVVTDRELFDTELMLRAHNHKLRVAEIPVSVHEKRATPMKLSKRVPRTIQDLATIFFSR